MTIARPPRASTTTILKFLMDLVLRKQLVLSMARRASATSRPWRKRRFSSKPTRQDVLDQCYHKAAIKPSDVDPGDGVVVYPPDTYDTDTIFGVTDETGNVIHLRNAKHTIKLGNYEMRNPPSHLKLNEPTARDAAYETEALIDHLFHAR